LSAGFLILHADKIISTVRRRLKKHKYQIGGFNHIAYLGPNALNWLEKTEAEVTSAGCELISKLSKQE